MNARPIRIDLLTLVPLNSPAISKAIPTAHTFSSSLAAICRRVFAAALLISGGVAFGAPAALTAHFGSVESTVVPSGLRTNHNVAVDPSGNVYIPNTQAHTVLKETLTAGGYTQATIGTGWSTPWGIAIDASGSLYITDTGLNKLIKLTPSGSTYTQTTIASGFNSPLGLAVDASGNIYIADSQNNQIVKETLSGGVYTKSIIVTGLNVPCGVAVDASGNLYIADTNNYRLLLETLSAGIYTQSQMNIPGLDMPFGVSVDAKGNLYVVDTYHNQILMETLTALGTYTQTTIPTSKLYYPNGVAIDRNGNVYISDSDNGRVIEETLSGVNFGAVNVGATSTALTMNFVFDAAGQLSSKAVLTQGAPGLDFADAGTGTCTVGTSYKAGGACTVNVTLTPRTSGVRYGAVSILTSAGSKAATGYIYGTGVGPQINFIPGTETTIAATGLNSPNGPAVDAGGNIYFADYSNNRVVMETLTPNGYTQSMIGSGMNMPGGVAVDGAGNLYVSDTANARVLVETPSGGSYSQSVLPTTNLSYPYGVAVDGSGNVYIADTTNSRILKETLQGGVYTQSAIGTGLQYPYGVAVDGSGNVYIADTLNNRVVKETLTTSGYTQSTVGGGLSLPYGIAVDGNGTLYVADTFNNRVAKLALIGGSYYQTAAAGNTLVHPYGVAVDGNGNLYVADTANNRILKEDFVDPPSRSFSPLAVGSTSAPQALTFLNRGNATLTFPVPATGNNPSIAANFTVSGYSSTPCTILNAGSASAATMAPQAFCQVQISFAPTVRGTITGTLAITDDTLNLAAPGYATQNIPLKSAGIQGTPEITWDAPAAISYGTALSTTQLNATNSLPGTFAYSPASGTILTVGTQTLSVTFTPTDATDYTAATSTVPLTVNQATQTITFSPVASPVTYGASPITLSATGGAPSLLVTFSVTGPATLNGSTLTITGAGTVVVTANQAGDSDYSAAKPATQTIAVSQAASTTLLTAATLTPTQGKADLLTATVSGAGTLSGTVVFSAAGTTICSATVTSGTATCSYTPSNQGAVAVTAQYQGDANHTSSVSGIVALNVQSAFDASISLQAGSTTAVYPGATNLTACVAPATTAVATGSVGIYDGANLLTTMALQGNGCVYWYIAPGLNAATHSLTAAYSGDKNNAAGSSAPTVLTVNPAPVNLAVATGNTSIPFGVSFHATVTASSNAGSPLGSISYSLDGGAAVAAPLTGGNASLVIGQLSAGSHQVTVTYAQQANYAAAAPVTQSFAVTSAPVSVALTPSAFSTTVGSQVTFTAIVTSGTTSAPSATGSVSFANGSTVLATVPVNANGQAVYSTSLSAGSNTITATFAGAGNYGTGSASVNIAVSTAAQTIAFASLPATATYASGLSYALTATATSGLPVSYAVTGPAAISGSTLAITGPGTVTVTASQAGNNNYTAAKSVTHTVSVGSPLPSATISLQLSSTTLVYPGATNITVCVTSATKKAASGTAQILDGGTALTTQTLQGNGCANWYITPGLAVGTHVFTANYSGDSKNAAGTSASTTITVNPVPVSMSISAAGGSTPYGVNFKRTVTLSSNAGSPLGSITYSLDGGSPVSVALSAGNALINIALPAAGSHKVLVGYAHQTNYAAATSQTLSFTVTPAASTIVLTSSSSSAKSSASVTFTAAVNSTSAGAPNAAGSVTFSDGGTVLATVAVDATGKAVYSTTNLAVGLHTISATFAGSSNYAAASASTKVNVTK